MQDAEEAHKAEIIKLKVRFESFLRLETWGKGGGDDREAPCGETQIPSAAG